MKYRPSDVAVRTTYVRDPSRIVWTGDTGTRGAGMTYAIGMTHSGVRTTMFTYELLMDIC
jgi:hypothetical protein